MFKLHIYNPEHDIALARNDDFATPPKAARLTRAAYGHVPALWAEDGDWVWVDDAENAARRLAKEERPHARVRFVTTADLQRATEEEIPSEIVPWGWDKCLVAQLLRANRLFEPLVPTPEALETIRRMSSREFAAREILPHLMADDKQLTGSSRAFRGSVEELEAEVSAMGKAVLKSPWSCSGRGVMFVESPLSESERGWVRNVLAGQGCVMIEPRYDKVLDFAMEFSSEGDSVRFLGLSLFQTNRGVYLQNVVDSEENKRRRLAEFIPLELLDALCERILLLTTKLFRGKYTGPFGIDMMIVRSAEKTLHLHPCVELNLRRTMGHVALL